jgi:putative aldouronate transport system permease protein
MKLAAIKSREKNTPVNTIKKQSVFAGYWKHKYLTLMFIPAIIYFLVFKYAPIYGIQIAFKEYRFRDGIFGSAWNGLDNFKYLFSVGSFWEVLKNTLIISFYNLILGFPAPIILALLLNEVKQLKFKKLVQTISYLPHFISWVVLGGLFVQFLSPSYGPINLVLKALGKDPVFFLADPKWFRPVLVITSIWKGVGWGSIIYLATLSSIDPGQYEAAEIDGANRVQKMVHITLPGLTPVITIMLIFAAGGLIQDNFDQIYNLLLSPTVYSVGDVLSTYTYRMGMVNMEYSFSTAVGLFTNVISFILIIITNTVAKRINEYGIW